MTNIYSKIKQFHRDKLLITTSAGIVNFILFFVIIWLSTLLVDVAFYFSKPTRWFVLILNGSLTIYFCYRLIVCHLINYLKTEKNGNYNEITREIGAYYPEIEDRLTNVYQLENDGIRRGSIELRDYAIKQFSDKIKNINFSEKLKFEHYVFPKHIVFAVLIASFVTTFMLFEPLTISLKRIIIPCKDFTAIPAYEFIIYPGNSNVVLGESLKISAKYTGPKISKCIIMYKSKLESSWQKATMDGNDGFYNYTFDNVRNEIEYKLQGKIELRSSWSDAILSDSYTINTLVPPQVGQLQIEVTPPVYTKLPVRFVENEIGDIIAYPGSKAKISAYVNKELQKAELVFSDSSQIPMVIRELKIATEFTIKKPKSYRFKVIDKENLTNRSPIEYNISLMDDLEPAVTIIEPQTEIESIPDAAINVQFEGSDDFGFKEMYLYWQILNNHNDTNDSTWRNIKLPGTLADVKYFLKNYLWDISVLPIGFDETIKYYIVVYDNDTVNGPKSGRSLDHFIHFPSLEKLFDDFADVEEKSIEEMEEITKDNEEIKKELEEIQRELKRENKIDWDKKREIEATLQEQKSVQEKLHKIEDEINKAIEKLEQKNLFSPELLEKYKQLQELFQDIVSPELLEAMEKLQKSLENLDKNKVDQALNNMKINQEQFKEKLERTLELFKKIQLEQEIDRLVQMAKALTEKQEDITKSLENNSLQNEKPKNDLIQSQSEQSESLEQLKKSMQDVIDDEMFQKYLEAMKKMQESLEFSKQQKMSEQMQSLQQQMSEQNRQQSKQSSEDIKNQLSFMMQQIQQSQQAFMEQDKKNIMSKMKRSTDNLLSLSKQEEQLMMETQNTSDLSDQFRDIAQGQQNISENMSRVIKDIIDLSQETFFLSLELSKALGKSMGEMRRGLDALEERDRGAAGKHQKGAMTGLNESVVEMQNSMQQMSQSSSASGFEQFMKQMQQMSAQQGQLNEECMNFSLGNQGNKQRMLPGGQGSLERMAAEQEAIRKSLEELNKQNGERSDILGRLDEIGEEMKKVVDDLQSLKIDRRTIERQQNILSRMLDTQKSVREREYSRQRKAEAGKDYARRRPENTQSEVDEKTAQLRKELRNALEEGYSPDYEKLIEEYFRQLNRELESK